MKELPERVSYENHKLDIPLFSCLGMAMDVPLTAKELYEAFTALPSGYASDENLLGMLSIRLRLAGLIERDLASIEDLKSLEGDALLFACRNFRKDHRPMDDSLAASSI